MKLFLLTSIVMFLTFLFGGAYLLDSLPSAHWMIEPIQITSTIGGIIGFFGILGSGIYYFTELF